MLFPSLSVPNLTSILTTTEKRKSLMIIADISISLFISCILKLLNMYTFMIVLYS